MAKIVEPAQQAAPETGNQVVEQIDGAPVNQTAETATEKKLSPKNKLSRGVDPSLKTTWVPLDLSVEDNERIHKVAAVRSADSVKAGNGQLRLADDILQGLLKYALNAYKEQFDADLLRYTGPDRKPSKTAKKIEEMTAEELEAYATKQQESAQTKMNAALEMLKQAKERAAAKAAAEATA